MPASPKRRRLALFVLFFLPGITIASWVTRTPDVRDALGASTAEMGLILFGLSVGSMVGILSSGRLVSRFGARPVIAVGMTLVAVSALTIGAGAATTSGVVVALGLALFGLGMGGAEVALNIEGADVERQLGKSTLPAMHGFFSLGTTIGAVGGIVATATSFPILLHLSFAAIIVVVGLAASIRLLPAATGRADRVAADSSGSSGSSGSAGSAGSAADAATADAPAVRPLWRDKTLLLIGLIVLALAMAEGSANDWLPLVMVDGHGFDAAWGSSIFAVFALSMTIGRFVGGSFVDRYGRPAVLCASALIGAAGLTLIIFVDNQAVAACAAILWGLGTALGFPVALSAAGASGDRPDARVAFAATLGYIAFLVGPPALGFLGEDFGLRPALIAVLALVICAAIASWVVGRDASSRRAGAVAAQARAGDLAD
ncbi:MFS transporter [Pseudoclavibacter sp. AY1F1]|uniref:MFS transporter n=1 Tax=Pseudoclavibacter sp. AY1F1 TaxID=2080583 RepID=UPI000CE87BE0|nr:MFS transporter [Pseudoclavibacter sp. AY1F1]PPF41929.1 MFS transporter [Pseudoclavibacter sp. AY1F1]